MILNPLVAKNRLTVIIMMAAVITNMINDTIHDTSDNNDDINDDEVS